ncbi:MAG: L-threonylcarbamoyladenylate synthase [Pigeon pea little leaf phytoplasma]|uniref:L-threonylcarbamoyladenylate synthase n=1 Tax=Candidatus Phytoplasma fabacearum TaxID=2982628 RepID=A0ABU8ZSP5_9MOLU|nr:L-threonylcarbamoyladenylate synthase ['Bituminaria bituminosa' little leaf phytoplasma]MDV3148752.1 L-threonylcarbamoyladenylate synthase [Pigeon pea little leaf phytoplasma]MDO7983536.1 L-threonylcarbamoyladenylate synthase ['Bituminaria bituminosa' little leaf phytoplasma]MDO8023908.1 L-threonylcarbamoyladenylate synthase ['Bituminaria bituminosa' little leaf phytoplasma]MDO8030658.1 L-threonylcarbamoyladenylate synthase ['Bituminaria bituminosa' little leaf phytoplasma]MDV3154044.1 L-th
MKNLNNIIIFPTDTVYGMGAPWHDNQSLNQIYKLKQRALNKPMALLFYNLEQIKNIIQINNQIKKISKKFWPGPLTLIVNTNKKYSQITKENKIGIRMPNHPIALEILKKEGPLKTTSVNKSGQPPLNNFEIIKTLYQYKVKKIFPNNYNSSNIPSTVIEIINNNFKILRIGSINIKEFIATFNDQK